MFENEQLNEIFFSYEHVESTTWLYLTSLLAVTLFFKFGRLFSIRNLDVILLFLFAPCFLLVSHGMTNGFQDIERLGYITLWVMGAIIMARMMFDCTLMRRPLLEPNMSAGGLSFLLASLLILLLSNVTVGYLESDREIQSETSSLQMPGYRILEDIPPVPVAFWESPYEMNQQGGIVPGVYSFEMNQQLALIIVIFSHVAIVIGLILVGYLHFQNVNMGLGAAVFYLLIPYTGEMGGHVDHILPGAFLLWAVLCYRKPFLAGFFLSLAFCIYYPLFLLPLWISFYWQRGLGKLLIGTAFGWALLIAGLVLTSHNTPDLILQLKRMHGVLMPQMDPRYLKGLWQFGWSPAYRIPLITAFFMLSITFSLWPAKKNLGTLMSCTAALLLATRFWNGEGGGLFLGWSLPLIILVMFRPNLEDRVELQRELAS
ncbi:MAG TPA: hypothetical protein EYM79_04780 [Planctomycetes bacterium]|nr:hypothetical protein [Planctomycetota bacterium]